MTETRTELRRCPVCECAMKSLSRYGVILDLCPFEHGLWFDRGELEAIARREDSFLSEAGVPGKITQRLSRQNCPKCDTSTLVLGQLEGFRIGHCEACSGLFLPMASVRRSQSPRKKFFEPVFDGISVLEILGWAASLLD